MSYLTASVLLFALTTSNHAAAATDQTSVEYDKTSYRLACDPSNGAAFLKGFFGRSVCRYIAAEKAQKVANCKSGVLKSDRCSILRILEVSDETYQRKVTCDLSVKGYILARLTGRSNCNEMYSVVGD